MGLELERVCFSIRMASVKFCANRRASEYSRCVVCNLGKSIVGFSEHSVFTDFGSVGKISSLPTLFVLDSS